MCISKIEKIIDLPEDTPVYSDGEAKPMNETTQESIELMASKKIIRINIVLASLENLKEVEPLWNSIKSWRKDTIFQLEKITFASDTRPWQNSTNKKRLDFIKKRMG